MKEPDRYRPRDFTLARLRHSRDLYSRSIDYDGFKRRYFIRKPRIASNFYSNRFYSYVKPFLTTRFENE